MEGNRKDKEQRPLILFSNRCKFWVNIDYFIIQSQDLESCNKIVIKGLTYFSCAFCFVFGVCVS